MYAVPATSVYGPLSVIEQSSFSVSRLPNCSAPKVDSRCARFKRSVCGGSGLWTARTKINESSHRGKVP